MFLPLTVTLVSAPGLAVFLVARSSFFTWATASIKPLNKRAPNRIRFISDVVPFSGEYTTRAARARFAKSRSRWCARSTGAPGAKLMTQRLGSESNPGVGAASSFNLLDIPRTCATIESAVMPHEYRGPQRVPASPHSETVGGDRLRQCGRSAAPPAGDAGRAGPLASGKQGRDRCQDSPRHCAA